jgi:hypothetical protein
VLGKECLLLLPEIAFDEVLYYTMLWILMRTI